jgi:hypothetical protein
MSGCAAPAKTALTLSFEIGRRLQETAKFVWQKTGVDREYRVMSEAANSQPKPNPTRGDSPDTHALDHVEKWMAVIREISGERRPTAALPD